MKLFQQVAPEGGWPRPFLNRKSLQNVHRHLAFSITCMTFISYCGRWHLVYIIAQRAQWNVSYSAIGFLPWLNNTGLAEWIRLAQHTAGKSLVMGRCLPSLAHHQTITESLLATNHLSQRRICQLIHGVGNTQIHSLLACFSFKNHCTINAIICWKR